MKQVTSSSGEQWVWQKNGAPIHRNHAGMPSRPVAVDLSVSRISNILHYEMREMAPSLIAVLLMLGAVYPASLEMAEK
jgi:hypothetical protein